MAKYFIILQCYRAVAFSKWAFTLPAILTTLLTCMGVALLSRDSWYLLSLCLGLTFLLGYLFTVAYMTYRLVYIITHPFTPIELTEAQSKASITVLRNEPPATFLEWAKYEPSAINLPTVRADKLLESIRARYHLKRTSEDIYKFSHEAFHPPKSMVGRTSSVKPTQPSNK